MDKNFWLGKRVFITGHTGFKGSWLSLLLQQWGAIITGYALSPPNTHNLFSMANIASGMTSIVGDIRNFDSLVQALKHAEPDIVFHMAAQALVRHSYINPVETYETNIMGTVYLFEALKQIKTVRAVVNVTTDKCYENKEWMWGYRESEPLSGLDPYSSSKACSELITTAYRNSYFHPDHYTEHKIALASVRAGNVIGGGDWATDRLIPDIIRALIANKTVKIRNPTAIRPWQNIFDLL
ncbi:MAG: CDP-glucose 4,6-dehydratase, partial [Gammaproteobacteria bacterium]|nr:CDP-glucose 4,6-dehydratase [Gammaproteobacteria bacterium]